MTGKVISFSRSHGYGFIQASTDEIVFFHVTDWIDYMKVHAGDLVEFRLEPNGKGGVRAKNVRRER